jgi:hypothetical protein
MEKRVEMFAVSYDHIAPESLVVATTPFDGLVMGQVYQVAECRPPRNLEGIAYCMLRTHPACKICGFNAATIRLREVTADELTKDQTRLRDVA